jgi:hypothetical protein
MQKEALPAITVPASFDPLNVYNTTCIHHWEMGWVAPLRTFT